MHAMKVLTAKTYLLPGLDVPNKVRPSLYCAMAVVAVKEDWNLLALTGQSSKTTPKDYVPHRHCCLLHYLLAPGHSISSVPADDLEKKYENANVFDNSKERDVIAKSRSQWKQRTNYLISTLLNPEG